MADHLEVRIPTLDSTNYRKWAAIMEAVLDSKDVWSIVTGERPAQEEADYTGGQMVNSLRPWKRANSLAKALIMSNIDDSQLGYVMEAKTAQEQWEKLRTVHLERVQKEKTLGATLMEFVTYQPSSDQSVDQVAARLIGLRASIAIHNSEEKPSDRMLVIALLKALSSRIDKVVISELVDLETITIDRAVARLKNADNGNGNDNSISNGGIQGLSWADDEPLISPVVTETQEINGIIPIATSVIEDDSTPTSTESASPQESQVSFDTIPGQKLVTNGTKKEKFEKSKSSLSFRCYKCDQEGHMARDCPNAPEETRGYQRDRGWRNDAAPRYSRDTSRAGSISVGNHGSYDKKSGSSSREFRPREVGPRGGHKVSGSRGGRSYEPRYSQRIMNNDATDNLGGWGDSEHVAEPASNISEPSPAPESFKAEDNDPLGGWGS